MQGTRQIQLAQVPTPVAGPGEVLLKVAYAGICGSDLKLYQHWGEISYSSTRNGILGHEFSGTIAALGEGVTGLEVGHPVAVHAAGSCGECVWCRSGQKTLCFKRFDLTRGLGVPGGFAEYVSMPAEMAIPLAPGADLAEVALAEPLSVALLAVRRAQLEFGDEVMIFGAGPIGQLVLQAAKLRGVASVTVVEPVASRRQMALECGADRAVDPREVDVAALAASYPRVGPDVVFECSGVAAANQQAISLVRQRGRVILVGGTPAPVQIDLQSGIDIRVSIRYEPSDFANAVAMITAGAIKVRPLITAMLPLAGGPQGFHSLDTDREQVKILLQAPNA